VVVVMTGGNGEVVSSGEAFGGDAGGC
jgi:hypothetical protein